MSIKLAFPSVPGSRSSRGRLFILFAALLAISLVAPGRATAAVVTNWVAYNDFGPGPGTAPGVSRYDLGFGPGGVLTNAPGSQFPTAELPAGYPLDGQAKLIVRPIAATGVFALPAGGGVPAAGTPADTLFNGIISLGNVGSMFGVGAGHQVLLTFTNLNPAMRYKFRGTTVRAGTGVGTHDMRWTLNSISGAASFVSAHTVSTTMLVPGSPVPGLALTNGQVAWNSGINRRGGVVGWDDIVPAPNGTFTIVNEPYNGVFVGDAAVKMGDDATPTGVADGVVTNATANVGYVLEAIVLSEYGEPSPLAWAAQPAPTVATTELLNFTLTAKATGTAPYYQWYKQGVGAISGANLSTYTKVGAAVADSGTYYCVATNQTGSITSSSSLVTVVADTVKPELVSIAAGGAFDTIVVEFSERVDLVEGADYFAYEISGASVLNPFTPQSASILDPGTVTRGTVVLLTLSPGDVLTADTEYQLKVETVHDLAGNQVDEARLYTFRTWVLGPANGVVFETFNVNNRGTIDDLISSQPNFPNNPRERQLISGFDSRLAYADDTHEDYAGRLSGLFIPPASGNWVFHMRSDDPGRLYINPTGPSAAGKVPVGEQAACCNVFPAVGAQLSQAYALEAGKGYYVELLWREYGGGDYGQVAVALQDQPAPTTANLVGSLVGYPSAPSGVGGTVTITQQPTGTTVDENTVVTLTTAATSSSGLPVVYQWKKDGGNIDGATGSSYTFIATATANYTVVASIIGAQKVSAVATVVAVPDTTKPVLLSAKADNNFNTILLRFSELVEQESAEDEFGYGVSGPGPVRDVVSAILQPDGRSVILTISPALDPGVAYTVTVTGVKDLADNEIAPGAGSSQPFNSWIVTPGFVTFQTYDTPAGGTAIDLLKSSPNFPYNPRETFYIRSFNTREAYANDTHEQFGGRMYGVFYPPVTGNWNFYLRSDDAGELYVNPTGVSAIGKELATAETACCTAFSAHASPAYPLTQGVPVYIEALYKEGGGGDYCQVAAKLESDPTNPDSLSPIPYSQLGTVVNPTGIILNITGQPTDQVGVLATPPDVAFSENFNASNGGFDVVNTGSPANPWSYDPATGTWSCYHIDACGAGGNASRLTSPAITVSKAGHVVVQIKHRYSFEGGNWDGAQLRVSVNAGPFTTVPASAFSEGGYESTALIGNHPLNNQAAWNGDSAGYSGPAFITSRADLGSFNPGDVMEVQLLGAWDECTTGSNPSWQVDSILVNQGLVQLYASNFSSSNSGFTVANGTPAPAGPWIYNAAKGTWSTAGGEGSVYSLLNGQTLQVTKSGTVRLTFSHRYNFEFDGTRWDGGQVRVSVNGGAYATVPAGNFTSNGYVGIIAGNVLIKGQPGFNGKSIGWDTNNFITSITSLGAFSEGDTVSVQFVGAWDEGFAETAPNWEIKQVALDDGVALPVSFTVTATAVVPGATGTPIAYQWQRDSGAGFQDIPGATESTLRFIPVAEDNGTHYRAIVSTVGQSATSASALLTVTGGGPILSIVKAGLTSVVVGWPVSSTTYVLEQASALLTPGTVWTTVAQPVVVVGGMNTVTIPSANVGNRFYRLVKSP